MDGGAWQSTPHGIAELNTTERDTHTHTHTHTHTTERHTHTHTQFVIAFLPRSKRLLISWLQAPSAVILEPKKIQSATVSIFFPICLPLWQKKKIVVGNFDGLS